MKQSIETALRQRGQEIISQSGDMHILLPYLEAESTDTLKAILYKLLNFESFRREFRQWAYSKEPVKNKSFLSYLNICCLFQKDFDKQFQNQEKRIQKYAHTFEWFISQMLIKKFGAKATGFGIRLKDASPDDEFDCIGLIDDGLTFVECKTGNKDILSEIEKFSRRDAELCADYSFFILDRDYIFSKSDDVPELKKSFSTKLGLDSVYRIAINKLYFYGVIVKDRYFLICPGFSNLEEKVRYMFRYQLALRENLNFYEVRDFHVEKIDFIENKDNELVV